MPTPRAFVIVIEDYGKGRFLPDLPGGNRDAALFIDWLVETKGVTRDSLFCCAGKGFKWRTEGTTAHEIIDALAKAMRRWADATDELYFYFWGHGFSYVSSPWERSTDVLVAADFTDLETGGRFCLKLDEVKTKLWKTLGPRHHYYFIDACRNVIPDGAIAPAETGLGFPPSQLGTPTIYKLFSTAQGAVAKTESGFTKTLVAGLAGRGRAKGLRTNRMYVIFDLLCEYMKQGLQPAGQDVDFGREGGGDGYILELNPIPKSKCEIRIDNARAADEFTLTVSDIKGLSREHKFSGSSCRLSLFPDDYFFAVRHETAAVIQTKPPPPPHPVDLYDPAVVHFEMKGRARPASAGKKSRRGGAGAPAPPRPGPPRLRVRSPPLPNAELQVRNLRTGAILRSTEEISGEVVPGEYLLKLRERGVTVGRRKVTIRPGEKKTIDLLRARPKSKVQTSILDLFETDEASGMPVFSERYLGPLANADLGLWLALFGAARIVGAPGDYRRLERLPLASFTNLKREAAPIYVLAGFEKSRGPFGIGLSRGSSRVAWEVLREVPGLHRIYERQLPVERGPHLLSLKIPQQLPLTLAVYCLPNRATLVTFAEDGAGRLGIHQFLLPINHLSEYVRPDVRSYLGKDMLGVVRITALAQTWFARKRSVQEYLKDTADGMWRDLVSGWWLDPLMPLIAAYDLMRHGTIREEHALLDMMNSELRGYFAGMPDIEAIAKLIGAAWEVPEAPPILLDGMLAFDDLERRGGGFALASDKLDYHGPWTVWRGAVDDFTAQAMARPISRTKEN